MNIQLLTPNFIQRNKRCNNSTVIGSNYSNLNQTSYPNLKQLDKDTVSFTGHKILKIRNNVISYDLAMDAAENAKKPLEYLLRSLRKGLKGLIASDTHPENPILAGQNGIKGRVKSPASLLEKFEAKCEDDMPPRFTKKDLQELGDLVGARIVMRSGSIQDFDNLFKELGKMVKRGDFKIKSVENYRPTSKDSYVSQATLDKFEETCRKVGQYPDIISKPRNSGYTAVHLNVVLPDGTYAEIQIMGRDEELAKYIQDFYYKYDCNKDFAPKYKPIQKIFEEEMPKLTEFQKQTLDNYIFDSFAWARKIPPRPSKRKINVSKDFLPWPYSLPEKLSYANIHKMVEECDSASKKITKQK